MRFPKKHHSLRPEIFSASLFISALVPMIAHADPVLPTIPAGTFTVAAATGHATTDTADLQAAINAAESSANKGGTIIVPAGTYLSNTLNLANNIDLVLPAGATIQNNPPPRTHISGKS